MNVGGPAHHVSILGGRLDRRGYETLLVAGRVAEGEGSAEHLARERGARLLTLPTLSPEIRPLEDLRALVSLIRIIRRFRPAIVHTHTAKAGFLGRMAARVAIRPRPRIVHTYHGHVLEGYYSRPVTTLYRLLERFCATFSDALIGVSQSTVDDLVRLGVAPHERFRVVPLGLELEPFLALNEAPEPDAPLRREAGAGAGDVIVAMTGRLAPIKRVDVALKAVAHARAKGAPVRLVVIGDGTLRSELERRAAELGLGDAAYFAGFRDDMPAVVAAEDVALLSSANEGTPVALIEAAAGGRPAVATDVGGVRSVIPDGAGRVVTPGDAEALGDALAELGGDRDLRIALGRAARAHVAARFGAERLVDDIDGLYRSLLGATGATATSGASNVDSATVEGFGQEWQSFDQSGVVPEELDAVFGQYFAVFPWAQLPPAAVGADLGCGSGRWAARVAPRVGTLHCIDASEQALAVARRNLADVPNCLFHLADVEAIGLPDDSLDFAYSLGVLHHVPQPGAALRACTRLLKPGAPLLVYLYYAFDNRPRWYRALWRASDAVRRVLSRSPHRVKLAVTAAVAVAVYLPLARAARLAAALRLPFAGNMPLAYYAQRSFYTMRTDAYDRFGTRLEHRFTRAEIEQMMVAAGLRDVRFSEGEPFWCAVGLKA